MIVVIVSSQLGKLLHQYGDPGNIPGPKKYHSLLTWLDRHNSKLKATFPGIEDESMKVYFELQASGEITESDLETLRKIDGIEGAYNKAEESLP